MTKRKSKESQPSLPALRTALLAWFHENKREMPWRNTKDPYAILVSEVMLQQTRVETVKRYYDRFLERFPTPKALAEASEAEVLTAWSGLGYYGRARRLRQTAIAVVREHEGKLPGKAEELRALPGVGAYTAGAVGSIAFGLAEPAIDGNVERVLTRVLALEGDPRKKPQREIIEKTARTLADGETPGDLNQALMELGATLCTPMAPRCLLCPARAQCKANALGAPEQFPEKPPAKAPRKEQWEALVAHLPERKVALFESATGRWKGMLVPWLLPRETDAMETWKKAGASKLTEHGELTHVLTHAAMELRVWTAHFSALPPRASIVRMEALSEHAIPQLTRRVLAQAKLLL